MEISVDFLEDEIMEKELTVVDIANFLLDIGEV